MGIIYETIIRSHTVKDTKAIPLVPWTRNSGTSQAAYLANAKRNCLETKNEIYINAICKRGLHIMNYPINHKVTIYIDMVHFSKEFAKNLKSPEQLIRTEKGKKLVTGGFCIPILYIIGSIKVPIGYYKYARILTGIR